MKKVISKLDKVRRQLLHKNSSGGAIPELKAKISAAERELELSETENAAVIDAEASLVRTSAEIERAEKENETAAKVISHFEDIEALRMKRELAEADRSLEEDKASNTRENLLFSAKLAEAAFQESILHRHFWMIRRETIQAA